MSAQLPETEELKKKFGSLIGELAEAKLHFSLYMKLSGALKGKEFLEAWGFWNYTITAHAHSTLLHICRVYDDCLWRENNPDRNPWHLLRLVKEVEEISKLPLTVAEKEQHKADLEILQKRNRENNIMPDRRVMKLREWRNKVICHRSQDLVTGHGNDFLKVNGFEEKEIQELINMGFLILEHWACCYESDYSRWISKIEPSILQEVEGVLPVLESLRLRLSQKRQVQ